MFLFSTDQHGSVRKISNSLSQRRHSEQNARHTLPVQIDQSRRMSLFENANVYEEENVKQEPGNDSQRVFLGVFRSNSRPVINELAKILNTNSNQADQPSDETLSGENSHAHNIADINYDSEDDCKMVLADDDDQFPLPIPVTDKGLVKRERDVISGNQPYISTVYFNFKYVDFLVDFIFVFSHLSAIIYD